MSAGRVLPGYGESTLADLLPSIAHHLTGHGSDVLELPASHRYVVLLVDGLGDLLLQRAAVSAPFLRERRRRQITSGIPSTTATSITSIGTGLPPGAHGMVGYSFREPGGAIMNALTWNVPGVSPYEIQPHATVLERLSSAGVEVANVSPARFDRSGLTTVALRGAKFFGVADEGDEDLRIALTVQAAATGGKSLVYAYERHLDHTGHAAGCESDEWVDELIRIDIFCERLRAALPADVRLIITGDHGMVDVPKDRQIVIEDEPALVPDVEHVGGEGRLRQLYVRPGSAVDVVARWSARLGPDAWVLTREDAIAAGWFGAVSPDVSDRIGDVLVAMATDAAVMTRTLPRELELVGMHGSLTPAEMAVPLIVE